MINFFYETEYKLANEKAYGNWIVQVAESEGRIVHEINYIFCDDDYLLNMNQQYLNHDTYTDIITFDYEEGKNLHLDIFISVERVQENSERIGTSFGDELRRVMAHGVLHAVGYKDKSAEESLRMRRKEEEKMKMFHVEHQ